MSKGKSSVTCYYCERSFVDEKTLIGHQQLKHFQCSECGKRLQSGPGLYCHLKVHKKELTCIPNALPGRDSPNLRIFGSQGVPLPEASEPLAPISTSTIIGPPTLIPESLAPPSLATSVQHLFVFQGSSGSSSSSLLAPLSTSAPQIPQSVSNASSSSSTSFAVQPSSLKQTQPQGPIDPSRKRSRPPSGPKLPTVLVYHDEDTSMEEKRGMLAKYRSQLRSRPQALGVDSALSHPVSPPP